MRWNCVVSGVDYNGVRAVIVFSDREFAAKERRLFYGSAVYVVDKHRT